jgi:ABC-type transport system involved in multi-copper enzyme maturation permease subunit
VTFAIETLLPGSAVLNKELRSASRRRRYYLLRSAYIGMQILAWAMLWIFATDFNASPSVYATGMMSQVARSIWVGMVWFQFLLSQILMVLLLSGTISEEMGRGTLGILLATPLTGLQITLGKLLSRGVHLFLLLGLSLPVLAIMRVWGGMPWDFLIATYGITLTAAWATASLSLLMSTWTTRMNRAAGRTFLILLVFMIITMVLRGPGVFPGKLWFWLSRSAHLVNPLFVMNALTQNLQRPGQPVGPWWENCLTMLVLGSLLLALAVLRIPHVARLHLQGGANPAQRRGRKQSSGLRVHAVWGPVLVWRTIRQVRCGWGRWQTRLEMTLGTFVLLIAYYVAGIHYRAWADQVFHATFLVIYTFIGLLRVAVHASGTVAEEREKRSWPLLLTTDLTARAIVWQKILSSLLRTTPAWALTVLHLLVFIPLGVIHPLTPLLLLPFLLSSILLLASFGICISLWCRRASTAVAIAVTVYLLLSIPMCCPLVFVSSPLFSVGSLVASVSGVENASAAWDTFLRPLNHPLEFFLSLWMLPLKSLVQGGMALGFFLIASRFVRRRVFAEGRD